MAAQKEGPISNTLLDAQQGPHGAAKTGAVVEVGEDPAPKTGWALSSELECISGLDQGWTPSYFTHVPITTPIVSALKNYYIYDRAF